MNIILLDTIFNPTDQGDKRISLSITGALHGNILGNNIHDVCSQLASSNLATLQDKKIYINAAGYGVAVADELRNRFNMDVEQFTPRQFKISTSDRPIVNSTDTVDLEISIHLKKWPRHFAVKIGDSKTKEEILSGLDDITGKISNSIREMIERLGEV